MKKIMASLSASSAPTQTLGSPFDVKTSTSSTASGTSNVIFCEFSQSSPVTTPKDCVDIDDLVAELEQDAETKTLIAEGRQWVAETFYKSETQTLAKLRLERGLSQAQLAQLVGTSQPHIARLETGATEPQVSTVLKLAAALSVSPEDVFKIFASSIESIGKTK